MARHPHPARIARLDAVQKAKQAAAVAALTVARDREEQAGREEERARAELAAHQALWFEYLGRPVFAPEFARAIAAQLLVSDAAAVQAAEDRRFAAELTQRRIDDWRLAEARVRATAEQLDASRRHCDKRREEGRLAAFSDRVTYGWMTP